MGSRDMPVPAPTAPGVILTTRLRLLVAGVCLTSPLACDRQNPAFTEQRSEKRSSDAVKIEERGELVPESVHPVIHDPEPTSSSGNPNPRNGTETTGDSDTSTSTGSDDTSTTGDNSTGTDITGMDDSSTDNSTGGTGTSTGGSSDTTTDSTTGGTGTTGTPDSSSTTGSTGTTTGSTDTAGMDDTGGDDGVGGGDDGLSLEMVTMNATQKGPGKVDILWVVDTSGSMAEEQTYLGDNFNAMITQLASAGHDFRTAVTTTDVCQDTMPPALADRVCPQNYGGSPATHLRGSFVGDVTRKVLNAGDPDLVTRFNTYVNQGINGSGFEHGLKAAEMAVTKSLNGQNEALVRSDAFLAVIVVSDEEDDGIGLSKTDAYTGYNFYQMGLTTFRYTEDDFIAYMRTAKGEGKFSVSAITPTRNVNGSLCSAPHSQPAEEGTQYIKAVQKSGGILQSICDTNWDTSLAKIGIDLNGQITQLNLEFVPNVPTIKVYVNDVQTSEWTYNAGNNAVKFNSGHVPATGAQIKITYYKN